MTEPLNIDKLNDRTFINLKDLREVTHLSSNTIHRWSDEGKWNKIKYRNKCYWRTDEVKEVLHSIGVLNHQSINTYDIDIQLEDLR